MHLDAGRRLRRRLCGQGNDVRAGPGMFPRRLHERVRGAKPTGCTARGSSPCCHPDQLHLRTASAPAAMVRKAVRGVRSMKSAPLLIRDAPFFGLSPPCVDAAARLPRGHSSRLSARAGGSRRGGYFDLWEIGLNPIRIARHQLHPLGFGVRADEEIRQGQLRYRRGSSRELPQFIPTALKGQRAGLDGCQCLSLGPEPGWDRPQGHNFRPRLATVSQDDFLIAVHDGADDLGRLAMQFG